MNTAERDPTPIETLAVEFPESDGWTTGRLPGPRPVWWAFWTNEDGSYRRYVVKGSPDELLKTMRRIRAMGGPAKASWLPGRLLPLPG